MKKFRGKIAMNVGFTLVIFGIIFIIIICNAIHTNVTVDSVKGVSAAELQDGQFYELNNVTVFNEYAGTDYNGNTASEHYYLLGRYDKSLESWVLYSLCIDEDNELFKTLDEYAKSTDTQVGDLQISLCAKANDFVNEDNQIKGYYIVSANHYAEEDLTGDAVQRADFNFTYIFDSADDVVAYNRGNATIKGITIACTLVVIILASILALKNLRRIARGEA